MSRWPQRSLPLSGPLLRGPLPPCGQPPCGSEQKFSTQEQQFSVKEVSIIKPPSVETLQETPEAGGDVTSKPSSIRAPKEPKKTLSAEAPRKLRKPPESS